LWGTGGTLSQGRAQPSLGATVGFEEDSKPMPMGMHTIIAEGACTRIPVAKNNACW